MLEKGAQAKNIVAAVGPCIAQRSYEVDKAFYDTIGQDKYFIAGREGHWYFDLEAYCVDKLKASGIKNIVASGVDTYDENNKKQVKISKKSEMFCCKYKERVLKYTQV